MGNKYSDVFFSAKKHAFTQLFHTPFIQAVVIPTVTGQEDMGPPASMPNVLITAYVFTASLLG